MLSIFLYCCPSQRECSLTAVQVYWCSNMVLKSVAIKQQQWVSTKPAGTRINIHRQEWCPQANKHWIYCLVHGWIWWALKSWGPWAFLLVFVSMPSAVQQYAGSLEGSKYVRELQHQESSMKQQVHAVTVQYAPRGKQDSVSHQPHSLKLNFVTKYWMHLRFKWVTAGLVTQK